LLLVKIGILVRIDFMDRVRDNLMQALAAPTACPRRNDVHATDADSPVDDAPVCCAVGIGDFKPT